MTLQHTATHGNTRQHKAAHCRTALSISEKLRRANRICTKTKSITSNKSHAHHCGETEQSGADQRALNRQIFTTILLDIIHFGAGVSQFGLQVHRSKQMLQIVLGRVS